MDRTFGIEIEAFGLTMQQAAAVIQAAGVPCNPRRYDHVTGTTWKVVSDGSINCLDGSGFEVVSPILRGANGLAQVRLVMDALKAAGAKVNKSCGLHVHVGAEDFTVRQFKNLAKNYLFFEDFFDMIMPRSRRGSSNEYIKSIRAKFGGYDHAAARCGMMKMDQCKTVEQVILALNGAYHQDRYYKLNLTAFNRHRTVEFRQHAGTIEADKAINWISLVMGFVDKAAVSKIRPRQEGTAEVSKSTLFQQFFVAFAVTELRGYFVERRRKFETEQNEG